MRHKKIERSKRSFRSFISRYGAGYLFLLPSMPLILVFVVLPVIVAMFMSMTDYNMYQAPRFIGLTNYKLLFLDDDVFLIAIKNTFIFAFISGPISFILSFLMAWLIDQLRMKTIFALAFYAPSITSGVAMSVVWMTFFSNDRYGLFNNFLINLGVISQPVLWVSDTKTIMAVVIFISIWMGMGTGFLTFLAGLQSLSQDIHEAALIDGVKNKAQELFYVILPQMKPQLLFASIMSIVGSFGVFDIVVTVAGLPSPNYAAHTMVAHLFDYAFIRFEMGYASAVAVILFLMTFLFGRVVMRLFRSNE